MIHNAEFGFHADACAPGILKRLEPIRQRGGLVLEIGCGTGQLTRHLVGAGHRVLATDASPAMLDQASAALPGIEFRRLTLPDDPVPPADAIVSTGHALNYLDDEAAVHRALAALAQALAPSGVLALDLCDRTWGEARHHAPTQIREGDGWMLVTRFTTPASDRFVRELTTFVREPDGRWRRDDERHENVLLDTSTVPELLRQHGVQATIGRSFGTEHLPDGLITINGTR